jgi:hypothetical protein
MVRWFTPLLLVVGLAGGVRADEAKQQLVVLRNGNVLHGAVEPAGDHWRVISAGTELHLRQADVDFLCDSMEAAYKEYRSRLTTPAAADHLQLAAWCVRHELWSAAKTELASVQRLEPKHPRLAVLQQTVNHLQHAAPSNPMDAASRDPKSVTSAGDNELLATDLPEGALKEFTRRVQPILVNNCTTSGCHRVDGPQQFELNRDLLHGMANRRSTVRNLVATLKLVNMAAPLESELLAQANTAHADMDAPPLEVHQRELQKRLSDWVLLVSGQKPLEPAVQDEAVELAEGSPSGGVVPISATDVPPLENSVTPANFELGLPAPKRPRVGGQLKKWTPRDEFDPEIFNRRQSPPTPSDADAETTTVLP